MTTDAKTLEAWRQDDFLSPESESYIELLYEQYLQDSSQVPAVWQQYFENLPTHPSQKEVLHSEVQNEFLEYGKHAHIKTTEKKQSNPKQELVLELISAFQRLGHLQANIDPLGFKETSIKALQLNQYGLSLQDNKTVFSVGSYSGLGKQQATLEAIFNSLQKVYCGSIGFEYLHINRMEEVNWLKDKIERDWVQFNLSGDEKKRILNRLVVADGLEKYLGFKYVGEKRYSLEGGDSLIPLLDTLITRCTQKNVKEMIIGMAHRGRLNVLVNTLGKDPKAIFDAFEGKGVSTTHSGDVKYHLGYSSTIKTPFGPINMVLAFNPSHLEIISPVVQGSVRSRQRRRRDTEQQRVIPIQIHGDAAFSGQGVVMETFNMSQARWFTVGGSIHLVINNQIGFTISNPKDSRSTTYCTDIAKMIEAPILHVNSADPEAVCFAALLAADYRLKFKRDIVIDLVCYRRQGHNEADEPSATQPLMYQKIKSLPVPYITYASKLKEEGLIKEGDEKKLADEYRTALDEGKQIVELGKDESSEEFRVNWEPFTENDLNISVKTSLALSTLKNLAKKLDDIPDNFQLQAQVKKMLDLRKQMTNEEIPFNWGYAETLAYATLLSEGYPIRLCGQDSARGTFAHRHAVLHDQKTDEIYIPLSHIADKQVQINIVDSLLSEEAVLAFEYGYSAAEPNYLTIWEAQFGDFANGAQVVIDQFISSGEQKWGRLCGLVLLLPHGYEGQGPEHSSARLERYLQMCAQQNMQVCVPTTPAQMFHLLRRQMLRPVRKPLIVMSPKSLLRHPLAVSTFPALTEGKFHNVIAEIDSLEIKKVNRVILCSGKVYYELLEKRRAKKWTDTAIIRIEQLYPFPDEEIKSVLASYSHVKDMVWCQEEPENQGPWDTITPYLKTHLGKNQQLQYAGRKPSASPAAGYRKTHEKEQQELILQAFNHKDD